MEPRTLRAHGFTLLEVMIVCGVLALLAAIAYPSYQSYVQKTRRAEGKAALLAAAVQMERYMTERSTYATATLGPTGIYPDRTEHGAYTLALSNLTATTFTLSATPAGAQVSDPCGTLTFTDGGVKGISGSIAVDSCW